MPLVSLPFQVSGNISVECVGTSWADLLRNAGQCVLSFITFAGLLYRCFIRQYSDRFLQAWFCFPFLLPWIIGGIYLKSLLLVYWGIFFSSESLPTLEKGFRKQPLNLLGLELRCFQLELAVNRPGLGANWGPCWFKADPKTSWIQGCCATPDQRPPFISPPN